MATLVLKKPTPGDFFISDVGVIIPGSGQDTFTDDGLIRELASSRVLRDAINAGTIVVNDGVQDLTAAQGLSYLNDLWRGVGFVSGQSGATVEFGNTGGVPTGGTIGLLGPGNTSTGSRVEAAKRITGASFQVNAIDASRTYNASIRVNGVEQATLALPLSSLGSQTTSLNVPLNAGDAITVFIVRTSGAGASTFVQMRVKIVIS